MSLFDSLISTDTDAVDTLAPTRRTAIKILGVLGTAVAGLGASGSAVAHDGNGHAITIASRDGETVYYDVTIDGDVTKVEANEATVNAYDTIEDSSIHGRTTDERDGYEFEGLITEFSSSAPVEVYVDETRIDLATSSEGVDEEADIDTEGDEETDEEPDEEPEDDQDQDQDQDQDNDNEIDESDYDEVIDIVDAGADDSGSSSIHSVLDDVLDSGVLVRFPPGEYRMSESIRVTSEGRVGMVGDDATIIHDDGRGTLVKLGTFRDPNEVVEVAGFTADLSGSSAGGRVFELNATEYLYVANITIDGQHSTPNKGPLSVGLQDADGDGLVENYSAPDGGEDVSGGFGGTGLLVSNYHEGRVVLRDCHVGPFPDNGLYMSNGTPPNHQGGTVHVEGGLIENANVAGVRLAGNGSTIDGTEFVYDDDISGFGGQRPIRVDWGSDLEIRNVDITMSGVDITEAIRVLSGVDSVTIENVTGNLSSSVRDGISIVSGAGDVVTDNINISGQSRYEIFEY